MHLKSTCPPPRSAPQSASTGESKTEAITSAMSASSKTRAAFAPNRATSPGSAPSPSTSCAPTAQRQQGTLPQRPQPASRPGIPHDVRRSEQPCPGIPHDVRRSEQPCTNKASQFLVAVEEQPQEAGGEQGSDQVPGGSDAGHIPLDPARLGRLIRRLCQFHAYLIIGMGPFGSARVQLQKTQVKQQLLSRVLNEQGHGNRDKQKVINKLGMYVAEITAETRHKFNGTAAYSKQLDRLVEELHEEWEDPFQSFRFYLSRYFAPGAERCAAAVKCQDNLSHRIQQAANVLEAKIAIDTTFIVKLIPLIGTILAICGFSFNESIPGLIRSIIGSVAVIASVIYGVIFFRDDFIDFLRPDAADAPRRWPEGASCSTPVRAKTGIERPRGRAQADISKR